MEKPDHQQTHQENGVAQVPIRGSGDMVTGSLTVLSVGLQIISEIPDVTTLFESTEVGCATISPCE